MKKRILAMALTLAMLLSMIPGQVFAAQTTEQHTEHNFVELQPETVAPTEAVTVAPTEPVKEQGALIPHAPAETPSADQYKLEVHEHCVYGENCKYAKEGKTCEHANTGFVYALNGSNFATSINHAGSYYLTDNLTLTSALTLNCGGEVYLCLNGFDITGNQKLNLSNWTKLYLCNCGKREESNGTYCISSAEINMGEFYLYGSNLIMNSTSSSLLVDGKFVVDGGSFIADPGTGIEEANIYVSQTSGANIVFTSGFVMNMGVNSAAICQAGGGYFTMNGDIELVGGANIGDIWLYPAGTYTPLRINIGDGFNPNGKTYTVRLDTATLKP